MTIHLLSLHEHSFYCSHLFDYLDRDEIIVAHMTGGVDALIKIAQGWPALSSPLKLISLKGSENSKDISSTFLCKVVVSIISSLSSIFFPRCFFLVYLIVFGVKEGSHRFKFAHLNCNIPLISFTSINIFVHQNTK